MPEMRYWQLQQRQGLDLRVKIELSKKRIRDFYEYFNGEVYISFSGGKDSTVMLHLIRTLYPSIPAVFIDTGLEYPEIREFVRTISNVIWIRPKMPFKEVLEKYGYPIISKEQSQFIDQYRNHKSLKTKKTRWYGNKWGQGKISEKWKFLVKAPFKISDRCCEVMKKRPIKKYEKEKNRFGYVGTMASDSRLRQTQYLRSGCNSFEGKIQSRPLAFWLECDIWEYIKQFNLSYSKIYNMGEKNTGCMFCMFGVHRDKINKFQRMKKSHPKLWSYCINKLGCGKVLKYLNVSYE